MFVRLTHGLSDRGKLVAPDKIWEEIGNQHEDDWYQSPYYYGEEVLDYWNNNLICTTPKCGHKKQEGETQCPNCGHSDFKPSIKGYKGEAWTDSLYWDLDSEGNLDEVINQALDILQYLDKKGFGDSLEVYFSGSKGLHLYLRTENRIEQKDVATICKNIAKEAGVLKKGEENTFDTVVYNTTRIFRIANTKHQKTGLYKVRLTDEELLDCSPDEIREIAKNPRASFKPAKKADASDLIESLKIKKTKNKKEKLVKKEGNVLRLQFSKPKDIAPESLEFYEAHNFNPFAAPEGKRRCVYILENGFFGPGERENALMRIAAYYRGKGYDEEACFQILDEALKKREEIYDDLNPYNDEDTYKIIDQVYSDSWQGGTYSCKNDDFLADRCDFGNGPCHEEKKSDKKIKALSIGDLFDTVMEFSNEAQKNRPQFGLQWLDEHVRLRLKDVTIINGANGSGKTSLVNQFIQNMNKQEIYHVIYSLDMADTSLFWKFAAAHTNYSQYELEDAFNIHTRNPEIIQEVKEIMLNTYPYTIFEFTSSADSDYINKSILRLKNDLDIDVKVAFIDYAGRLGGEFDNEFANATYNAKKSVDIARERNVHMMYISQVPREKGDSQTPLRTNIVSKNTGEWENSATNIINCWRPMSLDVPDKDYFMHLFIAKNRSGSTGERVFGWDGSKGSVYELDAEEFRHYSDLCTEYDLESPKYQSSYKSKVRRRKSEREQVSEEPKEKLSDRKRFKRRS